MTINARPLDPEEELGLVAAAHGKSDGARLKINLNYIVYIVTAGKDLTIEMVGGDIIKLKAASEKQANEAEELIWLKAGAC